VVRLNRSPMGDGPPGRMAPTWWGEPRDPEVEPKLLEIAGLPPDRSPTRTRAVPVPNDPVLS
jgi:hypothetical protein